jgi:hypothetical protein
MSEGGAWLTGAQDGLDWGDVLTTPGYAGGTIISPSPPYSDPTALLQRMGGWANNQAAFAHVKNTTKQAGFNQEVAFRLRSSLAPHRSDGYEALFRCFDGGGWYTDVVRWNGPLNDFDVLIHTTTGPGIFTGDLVGATIVGTVIKAFINGVVVNSWDTSGDAAPVSGAGPARYASGNPGMGFFQHGQTSATLADFGFTDFSAQDL